MKVENGRKVRLHYRGTLDDGSVFDESYGKEPLEATFGMGMLIPGFESGIVGMEVGEKRTIHIAAVDAYGERTDELVLEMPKEGLPEGYEVKVGEIMQLQIAPETSVNIIVTEVRENTLIVDANHSMAGKDLNFEIEVLSIE